MRTTTAAYIVTCEGPVLDYTARLNLQAADIAVLDGGGDTEFLRSRPNSRTCLQLQVEATNEDDAIALARRALETRPYINFGIALGERALRALSERA